MEEQKKKWVVVRRYRAFERLECPNCHKSWNNAIGLGYPNICPKCLFSDLENGTREFKIKHRIKSLL